MRTAPYIWTGMRVLAGALLHTIEGAMPRRCARMLANRQDASERDATGQAWLDLHASISRAVQCLDRLLQGSAATNGTSAAQCKALRTRGGMFAGSLKIRWSPKGDAAPDMSEPMRIDRIEDDGASQ